MGRAGSVRWLRKNMQYFHFIFKSILMYLVTVYFHVWFIFANILEINYTQNFWIYSIKDYDSKWKIKTMIIAGEICKVWLPLTPFQDKNEGASLGMGTEVWLRVYIAS